MAGLLLKISDEKLFDTINQELGKRGGVFKLVCIDSEKAKPVPRMLDIDPNGILYIGKTACFLNQVVNLKSSISPKSRKGFDECGTRYKSSPNIQQHFEYENLYLQLEPSDNMIDAQQKEIQEYMRKYGELPPLNK